MPEKKAYLIIMGIFLLYGLIYISLTSFYLDGKQYYTCHDDIMISMRYARNLVDGHGLVWNPGGERFEGFSNLGWVLFLTIPHLLGLPVNQTSHFVQLCGLGFLLLALWGVIKICKRFIAETLIATTALVLTAFYYPLITWCLQGFEVSALTAIAVWATYFALRRKRLFVFILLGLGMVLRMDFAILYLAYAIYMMRASKDHGTSQKETFLIAVLVFLLALVPQTLFRLRYFGSLLPLTYYLKMTGYPIWQRMTRGGFVFLDMCLQFGLAIVGIGFIFWRKFSSTIQVFMLPVAVFSILSIFVGGDVWETGLGGANRFIAPAMPMLFIVLAYGMNELWSCTQFNKRKFFAITTLVLLLSFNALHGAHGLGRLLFIDEPMHRTDNKNMIFKANQITALTTKDATVACTWSGIMPYFCDRYFIDILGKCDPHVAHLPAHNNGNPLDYFPGHMKWDIEYTFGTLKPDVMAQLWWRIKADVEFYYPAYVGVSSPDTPMLLRRGSPNVRWEMVR